MLRIELCPSPGQARKNRVIKCTKLTDLLYLIVLISGAGIGWSVIQSTTAPATTITSVSFRTDAKVSQKPNSGSVRQVSLDDTGPAQVGELGLRADTTKARDQLSAVRTRILEVLVKRNRLIAERTGLEELQIPTELRSWGPSGSQLSKFISMHRDLIQTRSALRMNRQAQLTEQIRQLEEEIVGLEKQRKAKETANLILSHEIVGLEQLREKGFTSVSRLNSLRRTKSGVDYILGEILADIARASGAIREAALKIAEIDLHHQNETLSQLEHAERQLSALRESERSLATRLDRSFAGTTRSSTTELEETRNAQPVSLDL